MRPAPEKLLMRRAFAPGAHPAHLRNVQVHNVPTETFSFSSRGILVSTETPRWKATSVTADSTVARRLLGIQLEALREKSGITMADAAASISIGKSTL